MSTEVNANKDKVEKAHGEALQENEMFEAQSEAQAEDVMREEFKLLETDFGAAEKDAADAEAHLLKARKLSIETLKTDLPNRDEYLKELNDIIKEIKQDVEAFNTLKTRKEELKEQITALNERPTGQTEAGQESIGLEDRIAMAQDMKSLFAALRSGDRVISSSEGSVDTSRAIEGIQSLSKESPEEQERLLAGSKEELDAYFAGKGVTRALGIREKAIDIVQKINAMA